MNTDLIAIYELKRQSFLIGYLQNPKHFDDALAFAYYRRIAPIFHENAQREAYDADPFDALYVVKRKLITSLMDYVDKCFLAKEFDSLGFYQLEEKFGGYKTYRMELINALEYARIDGRFDDDVWAAIERNAPTEACPLDATFEPSSIVFR